MVRSRYMSIGRQLDNERFRGSSFARRKVNDAAVLGRNVGERMFQPARIKKFRSSPRRRVFPLGLKQTSRASQHSFSAHDKPEGNTTKKTEKVETGRQRAGQRGVVIKITNRGGKGELLHRILLSEAVSSVSVRAVLQSFNTDEQKRNKTNAKSNVRKGCVGAYVHTYRLYVCTG